MLEEHATLATRASPNVCDAKVDDAAIERMLVLCEIFEGELFDCCAK